MEEQDRQFLIAVFKETGDHIRATEKKSLIVTGSYIALFSIFMTSITNTCLSGTAIKSSWLSVAIQTFFLFIGTCIYVMQQWYRAWKEHYLDVSLSIRKELINEEHLKSYEKLLPYWLRRDVPESRISVDNLMKYVTLVINIIMIVVISYQILELYTDTKLAILLVVLIIIGYIGIILLTHSKIRKSQTLFA